MTFAVGVEKVVRQAATVDGMLYLFGYIGLMGWKKQVVSTTTELFQTMKLEGEF